MGVESSTWVARSAALMEGEINDVLEYKDHLFALKMTILSVEDPRSPAS